MDPDTDPYLSQDNGPADPVPKGIFTDPQNTVKNVIAYLTLLVSDAALLPLPAGLTGALPVLVLASTTAQQRTRA